MLHTIRLLCVSTFHTSHMCAMRVSYRTNVLSQPLTLSVPHTLLPGVQICPLRHSCAGVALDHCRDRHGRPFRSLRSQVQPRACGQRRPRRVCPHCSCKLPFFSPLTPTGAHRSSRSHLHLSSPFLTHACAPTSDPGGRVLAVVPHWRRGRGGLHGRLVALLHGHL